MTKPVPPASLPCPLCDRTDAVRQRCYCTRVLSTGTQEWAYTCDGCGVWWRVRWHPSRPGQSLVVDQSRRKPPQTAEAAEAQRALGL